MSQHQTTIPGALGAPPHPQRGVVPRPSRTNARQRRWFVLLMLAPATLLLLGLTLFPFASSLFLSFTDYSLQSSDGYDWIGTGNYADLLTGPAFWPAFRTTLLFTGMAVGLETLLGLGIAVMLHQETRGVPVLRAIYMVPMAITPIAATFTFRLMYNPTLGVFNYFLENLGLPRQAWLSDLRMALPALVIVDAWQWTPFVLLIVVGGLSVLPQEPFEAAQLDGAGAWRTFRDLTLPMLWPYLAVAVLFRTIDAFKTFDIIYVLTGGGPGVVTRTLNLLAYKQGIEYLEVGYAASIATVMLVLTILFARLFLWRTGLVRHLSR
jgi:multiple sugar transport system permease protein